MKTLALIIATLLAVCLPARSQLTLGAGETYSYQFDTLPLTGFTMFGAPSGLLGLTVNAASLQTGDALLFEMFEDTTAGSPIFSRTVSVASAPVDFFGSVNGAWQDLQGSIRLSMVSGSATIDNFSVLALRVAGPGGLNQYSASIVPVPEPSPIGLLGVAGLAGLAWVRHRRIKSHAA